MQTDFFSKFRSFPIFGLACGFVLNSNHLIKGNVNN